MEDTKLVFDCNARTETYVPLTAEEVAEHDAQTAAAQAEAAQREHLDVVQETADSTAATIPGWATWTEAQVLSYIDKDVVDLASAKTVLRAMAQMLVALRNKTWPHLQGG